MRWQKDRTDWVNTWIAAVGEEKTSEAENRILNDIGREHLPPCAIAVLDGNDDSWSAGAEYFEFLVSQVDRLGLRVVEAAKTEEAKPAAGFVRTSDGRYLVQVPDNSQFGFSLCDDEQAWAGGSGIAREWELVDAKDVPGDAREELGWILDNYHDDEAHK